jgi:hypothetical protein
MTPTFAPTAPTSAPTRQFQYMFNTIAGSGNRQYTSEDQAATATDLADANAVLVDIAGNLYISHDNGGRFQKIIASTQKTVTFMGNGIITFNGDGLPLNQTQISPCSMSIDRKENTFFFADFNAHRVRMVKNFNSTVTTIAGNGVWLLLPMN